MTTPGSSLTQAAHVHVFSVFGRWCWLCGHRKRWWAFWETWTEEEHDEPF